MEDLIIVAKYNNRNFTSCKPCNVEKEMERAKKFYEKDLSLVTSHKKNYPKNAEYWQTRIDEYSSILKGGFEAITFEEYYTREKKRWCTGKVREISEEDYSSALDCLPPLGWVHGDGCDWFFMNEMITFSFTDQYYHDKASDKYYTAVVDIYDKQTWIDKLLNN